MNTTVNPGSQLSIAAFGGLTLECHGRKLNLANRKARALLGYLALSPSGSAMREQLVGLLWSESSEDKARGSLRQVIRALRTTFTACGFDGFIVNGSEISLSSAAINFDVADVLEQLERGRVHPKLLNREQIADSLLGGLDDIDPSFRSWLLVQREGLARQLVGSFEALLEDIKSTEDGTGKRCAQALLQLDPTHEGACRHLIRCAADKGDTAVALEIYNKLWELLGSHYDVEPSKPTQELIAAIKLGTYEHQAPAQTAPGVQPRDAQAGARTLPAEIGLGGDKDRSSRLVLIVSQFDLDGIKTEQRHICVGFRSELIATLSRFREWSVVDEAGARTGANETEHGALSYLLHGHLYQDQENVYLVLELLEPSTGVLVWSDRYALKLDNYFAAQREVVRETAYSLNVHISQERLRRMSGESDISLDIYDRWLRGHAFVLRWSTELRERATEIFESIIADAPNFAPAYSSLVGILNSNHFLYPGLYRTDEVGREALRLAKKAVEIDPLDSRSQLHLAWSQAMANEHGIAELGFKLACQLNDNDPWTMASAAGGFAFCGQSETAIEVSRKGLELSIAPVPMVWAYTACVRYISGDYDGCVQATVQSEDEIIVILVWKVAALSKLGRNDEAAKARERLFARIRDRWQGEAEPTVEAMIDWLVACFPIKDDDVRMDLRVNIGPR